MDKEVRITLVATGFASKAGMAGLDQEDELTLLLKGVKDDEELDMPSFLRRPMMNRRTLPTGPSRPGLSGPCRSSRTTL